MEDGNQRGTLEEVVSRLFSGLPKMEYDLNEERVMKKILIVDDRQELREIVGMTLNNESRRADRIDKTSLHKILLVDILEIKTEVDKAA